ncbi:MAG: hypothetical protein LBJ57_07975 [Prevotellaceae bacterium]|jgi:hypothetical protein|nr:hypothetical protein [Prevotellaceae bacterium]
MTRIAHEDNLFGIKITFGVEVAIGKPAAKGWKTCHSKVQINFYFYLRL